MMNARTTAALLLLALTACATEGDDMGDLLDASPDAAPHVLDAAQPADAAPAVDAAPLVDAAVVTPAVPCLEHPVAACGGQWADNSNRDTRYIAHPVTGKATFACTWQDTRCGQPWYSDRRCTDAYAAELAAICADVGGTCAGGAVSYCVAAAGL